MLQVGHILRGRRGAAGGRGHSALFLVSCSVCVCVCVRRCILTTVDPDTGVMSRKEPLDTLKR